MDEEWSEEMRIFNLEERNMTDNIYLDGWNTEGLRNIFPPRKYNKVRNYKDEIFNLINAYLIHSYIC